MRSVRKKTRFEQVVVRIHDSRRGAKTRGKWIRRLRREQRTEDGGQPCQPRNTRTTRKHRKIISRRGDETADSCRCTQIAVEPQRSLRSQGEIINSQSSIINEEASHLSLVTYHFYSTIDHQSRRLSLFCRRQNAHSPIVNSKAHAVNHKIGRVLTHTLAILWRRPRCSIQSGSVPNIPLLCEVILLAQ